MNILFFSDLHGEQWIRSSSAVKRTTMPYLRFPSVYWLNEFDVSLTRPLLELAIFESRCNLESLCAATNARHCTSSATSSSNPFIL